jgi:hypothetical protein
MLVLMPTAMTSTVITVTIMAMPIMTPTVLPFIVSLLKLGRVFRNSKATPQLLSGDNKCECQSYFSAKIGCFQKLPIGRKSA